MKLSKDENRFLLGFYNDEYIVDYSRGFIEGDAVFVASGSLQGRESAIRKIGRIKGVPKLSLCGLAI